MTPALWFQHLPLYVQLILALIVADWQCFLCVYARHILEEFADEQPNAALPHD